MKSKYIYRINLISVILLVLFLLSPSISWGFGYIQGYVQDNNNQPIEGASIEAGFAVTTSYIDGYYIMILSAETYTLTASATGYESQSIDGVIVIDGQVTSQNFNLTPSVLRLEAVYPTLGELGYDLEITLTGVAFNENTRVSITPDVGHKKAIIESLDTSDASDIVISGANAFIADGTEGLKTIDISDPLNLALIGFVDTPQNA